MAAQAILLKDASDSRKKGLAGYRVTVSLKDASGKEQGLLAKRTDSKGVVRVPLPRSSLALGDQPQRTLILLLRVIGLDDADELLKKEIVIDPAKPKDIVEEIDPRAHHDKLRVPIATAGLAVSASLQTALQQKKINSLADLRKLGDVRKLGDLSSADLKQAEGLVAHSRLQVLSRKIDVNSKLIGNGYHTLTAIASTPPSRFLESVKDDLPAKVAQELYDDALAKQRVLRNINTAQRVHYANGHAGAPQFSTSASQPRVNCCEDCLSALSPAAYLADLMDYAVDNVQFKPGSAFRPLQMADLSMVFLQPFDKLPDDCAAVTDPIRQVRLCIEVLRRRAADTSMNLGAELQAHTRRVYESLLRELGAPSQRLRLARAGTATELQSLGQQLGAAIDAQRLEQMILREGGSGNQALNESNIQRVFGFPSSDPATAPNGAEPLLLQWQREQLRDSWKTADASRALSLIDPDAIDALWLAQTAAADQAHTLLVQRQSLLNQKHNLISQMLRQNGVATLERALIGNDFPDGTSGVLLHSLGLGSAADLDAQTQLMDQSKPFTIDLASKGLDNQQLSMLLRVRKLARAASPLVNDDDWSQAAHILIGIEKRKHLFPAWLVEEQAAGIFIGPDVFALPENPLDRFAPPQRDALFLEWRFESVAQRDLRTTLGARVNAEHALVESYRVTLDRVEEQTLAILRDALIDKITTAAEAGSTELEAKRRWVTNHLLISASAGGCHKTTRVAQAIETLQLLIWGLQNKQFEDARFKLFPYRHPIFEKKFQEEWRWIGSYATWRAAVFVFLYPEDFLLAFARRHNARIPVEEDSARFFYEVFLRVVETWVEALALEETPDPQSEQIEELSTLDLYADTWIYLLREVRGFTGEDYFSKAWLKALYRLTSQGLSGAAIADSPEAALEYRLYLPLYTAQQLSRRGRYDEALEWLRIPFDYQTMQWRQDVDDALSAAVDAPSVEVNESWSQDPMDPFRIIATRPLALRRGVLLAQVKCLVELADSEFARDTVESLARAREFYLTAQRLLDHESLHQQILDCDDAVRRLVIEIGEDIVRNIAIDIFRAQIQRGAAAIANREPWERLERDFKAIGRSSAGKKRDQLRKEVHALVAQTFPAHPPSTLEKRRLTSREKTTGALEALLEIPQVFEMAQSTRAKPDFLDREPDTLSFPETLLDDGVVIRPPVIQAPQFEFCIPPNPLLSIFRRRVDLGLFKLNHCLNVAGMSRPVEPYAAPTNIVSVLTPAGQIAPPQAASVQPTQYRYKTLLERARQLVGFAQQLESAYLGFLERRDQETYTLLLARQQLGVAHATVKLQELRQDEATHQKDLADLQWQRANDTYEHYNTLIAEGLSALEQGSLTQLQYALGFQGAAAVAASLTGAFGEQMSALAAAGSTGAERTSMQASFERREQEWQFQSDLASRDKEIAAFQRDTLAQDHISIVDQEHRIAEMQAEHAGTVVDFLSNKFTSVELYEWMSGVVGSAYAYMLQQATAIAKLAEDQLAFERQEPVLGVIQDDYWTYRHENLTAGEPVPDRRGLTGSVRLVEDLTRLDQQAFLTERRKLQLSKTISLSQFDPFVFAQFKKLGAFPFTTTLKLFDRDFPGHYLRLIKRVKVSIVALIPPHEGIRATLACNGISRVVAADRLGATFNEVTIIRSPERVALTASLNATGVFELVEQPEMLLPFEGSGLAADWLLVLPKAANPFNFDTIADVLVTIEYTALENADLRRQVIQRLDRGFSADRPFSFRHQFADQFYDFHHPDLIAPPQQPMVVELTTRRADFPPNIEDLKIEHVTFYFARKESSPAEIEIARLLFTEQGQAGSAGGAAATIDGIASTRRNNGGNWLGMIGKAPLGEWELALPDTQEMRNRFKNDEIEDILFVITYSGRTPEWPA